ncbi:MAG: PAS domain-containing protein [Candidatus Limnocylindrales bacterium]
MSKPNLSIIPSSDDAFRQHVTRLSARHGFRNPGELAARLHRLFPRVVVRASEVSGQADTWYVYRDGVWRSNADSRWWEDLRSPRIVLNRDGWIEEANAPARAILGLSAADPLPRHFSDFVAPGTLEDSMGLFSIIAAGNELAATTLLRPTSGEVIACDIRAWAEGERLIGAFRLADDIPARPAPSTPEPIALLWEPAGDVVFGHYAREALSRMPEPTPEGLELRVRRLYPHARVEVGDEAWRIERDAPGTARTADATEAWWVAPDLATVRYDGQGRILDASETAERLLGTGLAGRHWQELVTPGTTDQVAEVLRLIADVGWAVSRFRMPGPDGYLFEFDSYTEVSDGTYTTKMRPRSA